MTLAFLIVLGVILAVWWGWWCGKMECALAMWLGIERLPMEVVIWALLFVSPAVVLAIGSDVFGWDILTLTVVRK